MLQSLATSRPSGEPTTMCHLYAWELISTGGGDPAADAGAEPGLHGAGLRLQR
ncbi:unnamed protein product, partial [Heterosigma akashiwo]